MKEVLQLLTAIRYDGFKTMIEFNPKGITHRGDVYNTIEQFQLHGSYEEDARYGYPAREKMKDACLDIIIKQISKLTYELTE